jgi:hypothetical protein
MLVPNKKLLLKVRSKFKHFLDLDVRVASAAVQPKSVDHLSIDVEHIADLVVVDLATTELIVSHELKLAAQVSDSLRVRIQHNIEESRSVTLAIVEVLLDQNSSGQVDIRSLKNQLNALHLLKGGDLVLAARLDRKQVIFEMLANQRIDEIKCILTCSQLLVAIGLNSVSSVAVFGLHNILKHYCEHNI